MDARYQLSYEDSAVPSHYGWKQPAHFDQIERDYRNARDGAAPATPRKTRELEANVKQIIADQERERLRYMICHPL